MRLSDPSGIGAERYPLDIQAVDSEELARSVRASLEATARRSGIEIVLLTPIGEALPLVAADRKLLREVLMNLCANAIEYNRLNGKLRIRIFQPGPRRVRIAVTDTGLGIGPAQQARLFDRTPALQARSGTERAGRSLAMTKWWVEQMGGELAFWSQVGSGSTFWVDLPAQGG